MQEILTDISWLAVMLGGVLAFILGAVWYSPIMFGEKWKSGIGEVAVPNRPMFPLLVVQFLGTLLFSWALVVALQHSLSLAILITFSATALIKANGLFAGRSMSVLAIESGYVLAQAFIVISIAQLLSQIV